MVACAQVGYSYFSLTGCRAVDDRGRRDRPIFFFVCRVRRGILVLRSLRVNPVVLRVKSVRSWKEKKKITPELRYPNSKRRLTPRRLYLS